MLYYITSYYVFIIWYSFMSYYIILYYIIFISQIQRGSGSQTIQPIQQIERCSGCHVGAWREGRGQVFGIPG